MEPGGRVRCSGLGSGFGTEEKRTGRGDAMSAAAAEEPCLAGLWRVKAAQLVREPSVAPSSALPGLASVC